MARDATVTHRKLVLGSQDTVTGWYARSYTEADTISGKTGNMYGIIQPRGVHYKEFPSGIYAREDAVMMSAAFVDVCDQVKDYFGKYYEAHGYQQWSKLDSHLYWLTQLAELPYYVEGATTADTAVSPQDPRQRVKVLIDTYLTAANITKEDGSQATTITAFGYPDYSIYKVFISKGVDGVFAILPAESTADYSGDMSIVGYHEEIPVQIRTIDKPEVDGAKLAHRMEGELRSILETYATGSQRHFGRRRGCDEMLGSTKIYGTQVVVPWDRGVT